MISYKQAEKSWSLYDNRVSTDQFLSVSSANILYDNYVDKAIRFIEGFQLMDKNYWDLFAEQFTFNADDVDDGWRCEYWGKMMRGASLVYQYTKNPQLYAILSNSVRTMLNQRPAFGRYSSYSIDNEFNGWDMWGRKYVLLGFLYFCEICDDHGLNEQIIEAMGQHVDYIIDKIGSEEDGKKPITETSTFWLGANSSSILEPIVLLYNLTGSTKYIDFAKYIVESGAIRDGNIFELAYEGKLYPFEYPETKAYETISCFEGLLEYYRVTKEKKYLIACENFAKLILASDFTIIGSAGCTHELFDNSTKKQIEFSTTFMQETCVTVTLIKYLYQMLCIKGDGVYADAIEISVYNALLGAVNSEKSTNNKGLPFDSYSPLMNNKRGLGIGGYKEMRGGRYYGCCAAIGAAGLGLIPLMSVSQTNKGIALNLYLNGKIDFEIHGQRVTLSISTDYPKDDKVMITMNTHEILAFEMKMRNPQWSKNTITSVNSEASQYMVENGYITLFKEWCDGDVVELDFDMPITIVDSTNYGDKDTYFALKKGPLILAGDSRICNVEKPYGISRKNYHEAIGTISNQARFDHLIEYKIQTEDEDDLYVVDYSSTGKTWDDDSKMTAWFLNRMV